jgi:hypothetical protein
VVSLNKGEVSKTHHSIGVDFIAHKLVKLKTNGDYRPYTTEMYKNEVGKYLVIFRELERHTKLDKITPSLKMKVIDVPNLCTDSHREIIDYSDYLPKDNFEIEVLGEGNVPSLADLH